MRTIGCGNRFGATMVQALPGRALNINPGITSKAPIATVTPSGTPVTTPSFQTPAAAAALIQQNEAAYNPYAYQQYQQPQIVTVPSDGGGSGGGGGAPSPQPGDGESSIPWVPIALGGAALLIGGYYFLSAKKKR